MEGRGSVVFGLMLLGLVGCKHSVGGVALPPEKPAQATPALEKPAQAAPAKRTLFGAKGDDGQARSPATYVAFGDFRAKSGFSAEMTPAVQQQCREEARLAYQDALKLDPTYLPAHLGLARLYAAGDDHVRATAAYQKATQAHPGNAPLWYEMGVLQTRRQQWPAATGSLSKAVQLDPDNRQYGNTLGFVLAQQGRYPESLQVFTRLNGPARAHYNLARVLEHQKQPELARQHAEMAVRHDPNLSAAHRLLHTLPAHGNPPREADLRMVGHQEAPGSVPAALPPHPGRALRLPPLPVVRRGGEGVGG